MNICSVGYGYFPHKLKYQAESCYKLGLNYSYLVLDAGHIDKETHVQQDMFKVVQAPKNIFARLIHYFSFVLKNKIKIVEVYDTGLLTFFYVLLAKVLNKKAVVFLIGMELLPLERGETKSTLKRKIKRFGLFLSLKLSNKIIYKELHMEPFLKKWKLVIKSEHLCNSVPIKSVNYNIKKIDIIYINTIRKMRYPILFLKSIKLLKDSGVDFNCIMKGFHSLDGSGSGAVPDIEAEEEALRYIDDNDLTSNVKVLPFSNDALDYIANSKIFILPSDVIYANYSLLEAMSYMCVPIVTNGNGAEKIIDSGVDGFVCNFSEYDLFEKLFFLLKNPDAINMMAMKSKEKIENKFNINLWAIKLADIYKSL